MGSITPTGTRTTPEWRISDGLTPYPDALALMRDRVAAIRAGTAGELVWLVEHPPIYTAGTSAKPAELTDPTRFPIFEAGRGGQWTYHGPGQRMVYVMLDLTRPARRRAGQRHPLLRQRPRGVADPHPRSLQRQRRAAQGPRRHLGRRPRTGAEAKIGAIGVRVSRWVSWHGVALNVDPDLSHFSGIVPCGVREHGVTSLAALGHRPRCTTPTSRCGPHGRRCSAMPPARYAPHEPPRRRGIPSRRLIVH